MNLSCTPHDLASLAQTLAEQTDPVSKRTSINRAYYAAYHALYPIAGLVPGDDASGPQGAMRHREVPRRLRDWRFLPQSLTRLKPLATEARVVAGLLTSAIEVREQADYRLESDMDASMVTMQLERMQAALSFASKVESELDRLDEEGAA